MNNSGSFTENTSTVLLNGTGQSISGSTTFYNLTKSVAAADTLTFQASQTTTIATGGTVTLNGASGQLLSLVSDNPGTRWNFTVNAGATKVISYVDVQDSDASGSDSTQKKIDPSSSINSGNNVDWFLPDILFAKTMLTIFDPVNGVTNPLAIPGGHVRYTITATNEGGGATDADSVEVTNPVPANTTMFVGDIGGPGSGPIAFTDGATASGLTYTFTSLSSTTDDVDFSDDNGTTYTYVPTPDGDGFDSNVTNLQIIPKSVFDGAISGVTPSFSLQLKVKVN